MKHNFVLFISTLLFIYLCWSRYIREKLPREIPFDLSETSFFLLCIICINYLLNTINIIFNKKTTISFFSNFYKLILFKPFETLVSFIRKYEKTERYYIKYLILTLERLNIYKSIYIFVILDLIPRFIIISSFIIDIFYFKCFHYFYKTLLLGILPLLLKIINQLCVFILEQETKIIDESAEFFCTNITGYNFIILSSREFLEEEYKRLLNNMEKINYLPSARIDYIQSLRKRMIIKENQSLDKKKFQSKIRGAMIVLTDLFHILNWYQQMYTKYRYFNMLIFSLYLLGWIYILLTANYDFSIDFYNFLITICNNIEPFSDTSMSVILVACRPQQRKMPLIHANYLISASNLIRSFRRLDNPVYVKEIKRTMLSGHSIYTARAAYHFLKAISNSDVVDNVNKQNNIPLTQSLVNLSLNHNQGIVQHKSSIARHFINHKFSLNSFYDPYRDNKLNISRLHVEPNVNASLVVMNEFPILYEFDHRFHKNIDWMHVNGDSRPASFSHQMQSNQDFWVMMKLDHAMGFRYKCVPHDEKSGMDMFRHTTCGTMGLLTYDQTGESVQMTSKPITIEALLAYNNDRIESIRATIKTDQYSERSKKELETVLNNCQNINRSLNSNTPINDILEKHEIIQQQLWSGIQCHPDFKRSVSFIFTKEVRYDPFTEKQTAFKEAFIKLLTENKMYDLNKQADCKIIQYAMLRAYKDTVDPLIFEKLKHLHYVAGIELNKYVLQQLVDLLKLSL